MSWGEWIREVEIAPSIYASDFMRLGEQDMFSPIAVAGGKATPPMTAGHGIEVNKEKLKRLAGR